MKFRVINSGDLTLYGTSNNSSLLDSAIKFKFGEDIKLLDKFDNIQNKFPEHKLIRDNDNSLSLSFKQWRRNEEAIYSIYLTSKTNKRPVTPISSRVIQDGNIIIEDLTNKKDDTGKPLLDLVFSTQLALLARILGLLLAASIIVFSIIILFFGVVSDWRKARVWYVRNKATFRNFITNYDIKKMSENEKEGFQRLKNKYIERPLSLDNIDIRMTWEKLGHDPIPYGDTPTIKYLLISIFVVCFICLCSAFCILSIWVY